ncbi:MAG: hypothetical protein MO852_13265 [Candidatus Devosia euplotis]|nr:hypothetical protein [Candidatus Devosia euplotis]
MRSCCIEQSIGQQADRQHDRGIEGRLTQLDIEGINAIAEPASSSASTIWATPTTTALEIVRSTGMAIITSACGDS